MLYIDINITILTKNLRRQTMSTESHDHAKSHVKNAKGKKTNRGHWSKSEQQRFCIGLEKYGKNWVKVQKYVKTRTALQIRSHAQKLFSRIDYRNFIQTSEVANNKGIEVKKFKEKTGIHKVNQKKSQFKEGSAHEPQQGMARVKKTTGKIKNDLNQQQIFRNHSNEIIDKQQVSKAALCHELKDIGQSKHSDNISGPSQHIFTKEATINQNSNFIVMCPFFPNLVQPIWTNFSYFFQPQGTALTKILIPLVEGRSQQFAKSQNRKSELRDFRRD